MIFYLVCKEHAGTITRYRASWGRALARCIQPISYERLMKTGTLQAGTYIFSDIERLAPETARLAATVWEDLSHAGQAVRLLNHPTRSMRRYELLRTLYERGPNRFNIYRLTEARRPERFPVFLRSENDHRGNLTPVLQTVEELEGAIAEMFRLGQSRENKLIVEFCNTADANGGFRKYSAFIVGDRIIPRHLFFSQNWMIKTPGSPNEEMVAEELHYLQTNPHRQQLREIFQLARIEYGRIDYGMLNGVPQIWEINTNPWIMSYEDGGGPARMPAHEHFSRQFMQAIKAIDYGANPDLRIRVSVKAALRKDRLKKSVRRLLNSLPYRHRKALEGRLIALARLFRMLP